MELLYLSSKKSIKFGFLIGALIAIVILTRYYKKADQLVDPACYHVDFDQSMKVDLFPDIKNNAQGAQLLTIFKQIYDKHSLAMVSDSNNNIIPKIIHIMWLGGKMPQQYEPFIKSWRRLHPEWTIVFWTDSHFNYDRGSHVMRSFDELSNLVKSSTCPKNIVVDVTFLEFDNKDMYDAAINYGEKSDILKWEVVYRIGGVYVDVDFEALKSLDMFHTRYDFYTGLQPLDTNMVQLGAALFAARPHHPILHACVTKVRENKNIKQIIIKTGPIHFTRCFLMTACQSGNKDVAFPASYFYPCDYNQKGLPQDQWVKPESFAVHHWAGSWLTADAFVKQ